MKANLLIDIGNSNTKMALHHDGIMSDFIISSAVDFSTLIKERIRNIEGEVNTVVISNVRGRSDALKEEIEPLCKRVIILDYKTKLPHDLGYEFDARELGADRIAAALAVATMFKGKDCILFNFGTALTVDFIDKKGHLLGGNISLGLSTRYRALHEFTGLLPLIKTDEDFPPIGVTTSGAMSAGVVYGLIFEVEGYIKRYPNHTYIFSGGDAFYFARKMKRTLFASQDLVLQGLALIAEYHAK